MKANRYRMSSETKKQCKPPYDRCVIDETVPFGWVREDVLVFHTHDKGSHWELVRRIDLREETQ